MSEPQGTRKVTSVVRLTASQRADLLIALRCAIAWEQSMANMRRGHEQDEITRSLIEGSQRRAEVFRALLEHVSHSGDQEKGE